MNARIPLPSESPDLDTAEPSFTAFAGAQRVAWGPVAELAQRLHALDGHRDGLLIFDDATGALLDTPPPPQHIGQWAAVVGQAQASASATRAAPTVGRPRLGVVAREVTLLPRHWEWLSAQPGGASAALRRLVDDARRTHASRDAQRIGKERTYRVMSALSGHLPGFEEASRALFAHDAAAFAERIDPWPPDVRAHLAWLARDAFDKAAE